MTNGPNARGAAARAVGWAKRREPHALRAIYATRRAAFIARARALAAWNNAEITLDIAPDVRFGKNIALTVYPDSKNFVRIGPGSNIDDRVLFFLNNGKLLFGERIEVRRDTVFMMWGGTLELAGENILSWGNVFHCAESIRFGKLSSTNEWVTVVDSSHYFTEPDRFFYHNTKTGPIEVGYNTWLCSKSTIARGAKVGDHCIVAGNSIVTGEVPSGHLASGVPAKVVRPITLPWQSSAADLVRRSSPPARTRRKAARPGPPDAEPAAGSGS